MKMKIRENLLLCLSIICLSLSIVFLFTNITKAYQNHPTCVSCGGTFDDSECYNVNHGYNSCYHFNGDCLMQGACVNGEPVQN